MSLYHKIYVIKLLYYYQFIFYQHKLSINTKQAFNKCNLSNSSYSGILLTKLHWLSLKNRGIFLDLIFLIKIVNGLCDLNFNDFFSFKKSHYFWRSHHLQITVKNKFLSTQHSNSFFVRTPLLWNGLPVEIVEVKCLTQFKIKLKSYLKSLPV